MREARALRLVPLPVAGEVAVGGRSPRPRASQRTALGISLGLHGLAGVLLAVIPMAASFQAGTIGDGRLADAMDLRVEFQLETVEEAVEVPEPETVQGPLAPRLPVDLAVPVSASFAALAVMDQAIPLPVPPEPVVDLDPVEPGDLVRPLFASSEQSVRPPPASKKPTAPTRPATRSSTGGSSADQGVAYRSRAALVYPAAEKQRGIGGLVRLRLLVTASGRVGSVQVTRSSGSAALDQAAISCARRSSYRSATRNGRPVDAWVDASFRFQG